MNISLAMLRKQLYAMRSWDSSGQTVDGKIRDALNVALRRMASDVPQALVPDEEHIVLRKDVISTDSAVNAKVVSGDNDKRLLKFVDTKGLSIGAAASDTSWRPVVTGEWDGIMHIEITDENGQIHRRQCLEWFKRSADAIVNYFVTLDRPYVKSIAEQGDAALNFRIHQPEFFFSDDVMEVLEPARIFDGTRQQVWKIDTGGASRQDMLDFEGNSKGRPFRCWRGRHFQMKAPTEPPKVFEVDFFPEVGTDAPVTTDAALRGGLRYSGMLSGGGSDPTFGAEYEELTTRRGNTANNSAQSDEENSDNAVANLANMASVFSSTAGAADSFDAGAATPGKSGPRKSAPLPSVYKWANNTSLRRGTWAVCYTYVWGRKDVEWQQSPLVTPGGDTEQDSSYGLTWAYKVGSVTTGENQYSGIHDPTFESAPSPVTVYVQRKDTTDPSALIISATNIDAMQGFGDPAYTRHGRSGMRIRYYVAQLSSNVRDAGNFNDIETNTRFHLLCEVEPTYDHPTKLETDSSVAIPEAISSLSTSDTTAGRIVWTGKELYDYHRQLKHSTGYYAWKVFPHQDARYELDFRVNRLPKEFRDDADTAPIHPEAIPTLIELALYYVSLADGNDQISAQAHLNRYQDLVRVFRQRYANPGGIVEPTPLLGYPGRHRYGTFGSTSLED